MGIREDRLEKLNAWIDAIPLEAKKKCAICTETLVHIVKRAEVETGVGTATATRALADRINDGAAQQDVVSAKALDSRVRYHEGKKESRQNAGIHENPDAPTVKHGDSGDIIMGVDRKVKAGMSIRAASAEVAELAGKKPSGRSRKRPSVRVKPR